MKKKMFISFLMICMVQLSAQSQTERTIRYLVSITEINSEEATKEVDYLLRPIFDVPGKFNPENGKIIFSTKARITKEILEERLLLHGYHLEEFEIKTLNVKL